MPKTKKIKYKKIFFYDNKPKEPRDFNIEEAWFINCYLPKGKGSRCQIISAKKRLDSFGSPRCVLCKVPERGRFDSEDVEIIGSVSITFGYKPMEMIDELGERGLLYQLEPVLLVKRELESFIEHLQQVRPQASYHYYREIKGKFNGRKSEKVWGCF